MDTISQEKGLQERRKQAGKEPGSCPRAGVRGQSVRTKIRRGGGGGVATTSLKILIQNVCGWNSKKASMPNILEKLTGRNQIKLKGYHCSLRNRKALKTMGGVCTAVENHLKSKTVVVKEGENNDEYIF